MKKTIFFILLFVVLYLCGCSPSNSVNVETLKGWSFQYNQGTNDYSLFFGLLNEKDEYMSADVDVDIRITDEEGNELYNQTHSVTKKDFGYYTSQLAGEQYLAEIRIKAAEINEGVSSSGKVYLTVYKEGYVRFDEVNCSALYCLPTKDVSLENEQLPLELNVKGFDGTIESVIKIEDVSYKYDNSLTPRLEITVSGVKTYGGNNTGYDMISYKLYDSSNYLVDSGNLFLRDLSAGDKFKDDSINIYDVKPGESYLLKFAEYSW